MMLHKSRLKPSYRIGHLGNGTTVVPKGLVKSQAGCSSDVGEAITEDDTCHSKVEYSDAFSFAYGNAVLMKPFVHRRSERILLFVHPLFLALAVPIHPTDIQSML
jgi:hypothetical protein